MNTEIEVEILIFSKRLSQSSNFPKSLNVKLMPSSNLTFAFIITITSQNFLKSILMRWIILLIIRKLLQNASLAWSPQKEEKIDFFAQNIIIFVFFVFCFVCVVIFFFNSQSISIFNSQSIFVFDSSSIVVFDSFSIVVFDFTSLYHQLNDSSEWQINWTWIVQ